MGGKKNGKSLEKKLKHQICCLSSVLAGKAQFLVILHPKIRVV